MNTQFCWSLIKRINRRLVTGYILSLLLFFAPAAIADFAPRNRKPASDYSRTGGPRGCPGEAIPLTLLAPKTYIGYTAASHPTFGGFVSSAHKIEFRLFEFESTGQLKQWGNPIEKQVTGGIFKISLSENQPGLTIGKKYLWQVAIRCPDTALIARSEFTVIEMPLAVKSKLLSTMNDSQRANIYAEADLWYEALAEALKLAEPGQLGQVGSTLIQDLGKSELPGEKEQERIQHLQKIAIQEK
ncbi:hypothetical protein VF14_18965 [Nostoc linckia z18]|jgi:hypothetical protein|uniref:DUF928 domain-containing protein n=2 Tax=Nostoc linckia TaxID=92942 RepID=A0A9Q5ZBJ2_NOSLI|nr:DUF928 domain-containing protein [Nostoc linckia]PHK41555.1 hypothetical protein VF12_06345 [Nostoc linckia z15]PHK45136.1 hypothetical protein VF13_18200 [Nostoc linckia z16]PHJ58486.1 hypothetical protein VF02_27685 [Nostoc linckia z1]PHJ60753.1 hypothetical protein VF05_30095 [Nostoc linckia z3]PHJ65772.1 hypothetical protein VF03_27595 [Nostoc linckia z2]